MNPTVILLGQKTFTESAFVHAGEFYEIPKLKKSRIIRVNENAEILPTLAKTPGAYSCMAIDTDTDGSIRDNFIRFSELAPFDLTILGCVKERVRFGFHIHKDTHPSEIVGVIGHHQALLACRKPIEKLGITQTLTVGNNNIGISEVAENPIYRKWAALGPNENASEKNLQTLRDDFGNGKTFTSFLIMHHGTNHVSKRSENNSCLIFFDLENRPAALLGFLENISGFNLSYIHSCFQQKTGGYRFGIEMEVPREKLSLFKQTRSVIQTCAKNVWILGPYECR